MLSSLKSGVAAGAGTKVMSAEDIMELQNQFLRNAKEGDQASAESSRSQLYANKPPASILRAFPDDMSPEEKASCYRDLIRPALFHILNTDSIDPKNPKKYSDADLKMVFKFAIGAADRDLFSESSIDATMKARKITLDKAEWDSLVVSVGKAVGSDTEGAARISMKLLIERAPVDALTRYLDKLKSLTAASVGLDEKPAKIIGAIGAIQSEIADEAKAVAAEKARVAALEAAKPIPGVKESFWNAWNKVLSPGAAPERAGVGAPASVLRAASSSAVELDSDGLPPARGPWTASPAGGHASGGASVGGYGPARYDDAGLSAALAAAAISGGGGGGSYGYGAVSAGSSVPRDGFAAGVAARRASSGASPAASGGFADSVARGRGASGHSATGSAGGIASAAAAATSPLLAGGGGHAAAVVAERERSASQEDKVRI